MCLGSNLYIYKGGWGLPSIDFECLRCLCLIQFTRCPIQINTNGNPLRSGAGKLPYLQVGDKKYVGYRNIKKFLDNESYPIDKHLGVKERYLSPAYSNWVFTNLHAYYHYFLFGEANNYDLSRSLYAKRTPFPFRFYYPGQYQKEAHDIVLTMGGFEFHDKMEKHNIDYLVLNAKKCVNLLSRMLGNKVWFFGDVFSEFDATVYSYLAILYKIPLSNNPLQTHLKGCPNLINFINRISKDIFKSETVSSMKKSKSSTTGSEDVLTESERHVFEWEKTTKILACVMAIASMGAFAAWRGILQKSSYPGFYGFVGGDDMEEDDDTD